MLYLSDGNPGAIDVMGKVLKNYPSYISSILTLLRINNIRGSFGLFINYVIRTYIIYRVSF